MSNKMDLPNIGDKIQINIKRNLITQSYTSQILDILDEKNYIISGPIQRSAIISIRTGTEVEIYYTREERGRFNFKGKIKECYTDKIYKLHIERVSDTTRLQERDYYRLPSEIKVLKIFINSDNKEKSEMKEHCIIQDISGGGLRVLCNHSHNIGDKVECTFKLNKNEMILQGIVVRKEKENKKKFKYSIGIQFIDVSKEKREEIIKYIFEEQRKLRKKGLI